MVEAKMLTLSPLQGRVAPASAWAALLHNGTSVQKGRGGNCRWSKPLLPLEKCFLPLPRKQHGCVSLGNGRMGWGGVGWGGVGCPPHPPSLCLGVLEDLQH